jgi:hypothetical protein
MKRLFSLALAIVGCLCLALMLGPAGTALASPGGLVNLGFETGDFTGWSTGTVVNGVNVVGPDGFATPPEGSYMARLGMAAANNPISQPPGPNEIYQDFVASGPSISFVYNIYTWDYQGYNNFEYELTATDTGTVIASYSQGAWGPPGAILKSTGWRQVTINTTGYIGRPLRLLLSCGGTRDNQLPTWAYVDLSAPAIPSVPGVSWWGSVALGGLLCGTMVWVLRRRPVRSERH